MQQKETIVIFDDEVCHAKMTPTLARELAERSRVPVTVLQLKMNAND